MNFFTVVLISTSFFLSGCAATAIVNTKAEGYYLKYTALEAPSAYNINSKNVLLCFYGKYRSDGVVSSKDEGDYVVLLPNHPPFGGTHSSKVIEKPCAEYISDLQTSQDSLTVYTVKKDKNCAHNDDCIVMQWEIYKDKALINKGQIQKENKRSTKEYFNKTIIKNISIENNSNAIYAVEDKYREQQSKKITNGKKFHIKYYYEYHLRGYDLYYVNDSEVLKIDLQGIYKDGNTAWYVLTPFTILLDIVTFPFQLYFGWQELKQIGK